MNLRRAWAGVVSLFRRDELDREFDQELEAHIDLATQDYLRQGLDHEEARRHALIRLGGREQAREVHREARGVAWLEGVVHDFSYALRGFRRSPGFTFAALAMLTLAIALNVAVFTVVDTVLYRGYPMLKESGRLLYIQAENPRGCCGVAYPDFLDWRAQAQSFDGMAATAGIPITLGETGQANERLRAARVSPNTFGLAGQQPILGRDFTPADAQPGARPVAILSHLFWQRRYASDPNIIGRSLLMNDQPTTVIGVMPEGFLFPQELELWVPLIPGKEEQDRATFDLHFVLGRLAEGVSREQATAELESIARQLAREYPETNKGVVPRPQDFTEFFVGPDAAVIYGSMWGAAVFVLLIACANLANLNLARTLARSRELSIRIAIGAGRWRMIRQMLTESLLLAAAASLLGWWIARWGAGTYAAATASQYQVLDYTMDGTGIAYLLAIAAVAGLVFGLVPVVRLMGLNVNDSLKDGSRGGSGGSTGGVRGKRLSAALVTGQMALAVMLLSGAAVLVRSFLNFYTADIGVNSENVLTGFISLPEDAYPAPESQIAFFDQLRRDMEAIPGVEAFTMASQPPAYGTTALPFSIEGAPEAAGPEDARPTVPTMTIGVDYFKVMEAGIHSGREFRETDRLSSPPVAIVNQRFAELYWPGENPIGRRLRLYDSNSPTRNRLPPAAGADAGQPWRTVVGVVANIRQIDPTRQTIHPTVYLPYLQRPATGMWPLMRTTVPPETLAAAYRQQVRSMDADLYIWELSSLEASQRFSSERMDVAHRDTAKNAVLFPIFAITALLLAAIGLYAVIAHSVHQRTQEIGVRMAVGAGRNDIRKLIFGEGMRPVATGLLIGLAGSVAVTRLLESQLVGVSPGDPVTFVVAAATLIVAALLGCQIPVRRAMRVDPMAALRHE